MVSYLDALHNSSANRLTPCGSCRQGMVELAPNATIYIDGIARDFTISELMPYPFGPEDGRVDIGRLVQENKDAPGIAFAKVRE